MLNGLSYKRCGLACEDIIHALRGCLDSMAVVRLSGLIDDILNCHMHSCIDWWENAIHLMDIHGFALPILECS